MEVEVELEGVVVVTRRDEMVDYPVEEEAGEEDFRIGGMIDLLEVLVVVVVEEVVRIITTVDGEAFCISLQIKHS